VQVPARFEYEVAGSVGEAVELLERYGEGAYLIAGGHSLIPMMKLRLAAPEVVVDISGLDSELRYIEDEGGGLPYVGLVASARRAGQVLSVLRSRGREEGELAVVRSPAGLPLGTSGQEGISLSVLAEISSLRAESRPSLSGAQERESTGEPDEAVDPVCGMAVEVASARHVVEHGGTRYYFCCAGCRRAFEQDPEKYAAQVSLR
jgi:YHS domain-containing protein